MKVLAACEFSGTVRDAFSAAGHDAYSCDVLPAPGHHYQCDVRELDLALFDLVIAFPPCTYICSSGARWWKNRRKEQRDALELIRWFFNAPTQRLALENPIGCISTKIKKPTQIIQPWQFGHGETKATCLWLTNLPMLKPTKIVDGRESRIHKMPPSKDRWKKRSVTFEGIADAMAQQWGELDAMEV